MSTAFDMRAWMRGELPFHPAKEPKPGSKVRYYGLYETKKGIRTFIVKDRNLVPSNALQVLVTEEDALALSQELFRQHLANDLLPPSKKLDMSGYIGHHSDGGAVHTAICVGIESGECLLLFLTSHPGWNPFARPLRKDEAPFTGFTWNEKTYLAPVFRAEASVSWTPRRLPEHRVEDLKAEFFSVERFSTIYSL